MTSKISAENALERFRKMCLELPETSETGSWGHPNFRAGKRTFTTFEWIGGRPSLAFNLGEFDSDQLLLKGDPFFATPYGRGRWVSVWADVPVDWDMVEELVERSYRRVALKRMIVALENS